MRDKRGHSLQAIAAASWHLDSTTLKHLGRQTRLHPDWNGYIHYVETYGHMEAP